MPQPADLVANYFSFRVFKNLTKFSLSSLSKELNLPLLLINFVATHTCQYIALIKHGWYRTHDDNGQLANTPWRPPKFK